MQPVIGLEGSGADIELEMVLQTAKAYCLRTWFDAEFWLPKTAFENDGTLSAWGRRLYQEKLDEAAEIAGALFCLHYTGPNAPGTEERLALRWNAFLAKHTGGHNDQA